MTIVFGTITAEEGTPPFPITVRAFDKDMRSEELLGEVVSTSGTYSITYSAEQIRRAEKKMLTPLDLGKNQEYQVQVIIKVEHCNTHTPERVIYLLLLSELMVKIRFVMQTGLLFLPCEDDIPSLLNLPAKNMDLYAHR